MIFSKNFKAALIGRRLSHSISPEIHRLIASYDYSLLELENESEVISLLNRMKTGNGINALNVTIPYKETVFPALNRISQTSRSIGAVNTIIVRGFELYGFNTDLSGLISMLKTANIEINGRKALILGSGGTSKTAFQALRTLGASEVIIISRTGTDNYLNLYKHFDAELIVNTTPVGMYPNNGAGLYITEDGQLEASDKSSLPEFPLERFGKLKACVDLIYNPSRTPLLTRADELGIIAINGLHMLVAQAVRARDIFLGKTEDDDAPFDADESQYISDLTRTVEVKNKSIGLVGMPGCGKTSIGKRIAKLAKRRFIDIDEMIVNKIGMTVPEIFAKYGEEGFRDFESDCVSIASKESGCVIAYGGGSPLREINRRLIRQNSTVFWIERPISLLSRENRPLSQALNEEEMWRLYIRRKPYYEAVSDFKVSAGNGNDGIEAAAERILLISGLKDII
ncbi:MAG: AAA family ATPase [Clostridiales bacterium]|nr:AAA family ATPase [Clostridiales bacterium]